MRKLSLVSLAALSFFMAGSLAAAQAPAQASADNGWKVTVAPYFVAASMTGKTAIKGHEIDVDMSFSDLLENLEFGIMGLAVARKGAWGFGGDALWVSLGANGTTPGPAAVGGSVDMDQGAFSFYGLRRLAPVADLMFGVRVNTLRGKLAFEGPGMSSVDGSRSWVDPVVGLQLRTPDKGGRWYAQVYSEVGGFGAGSDFTWQVFPTVGVKLAKWAALDFGYRWLGIDYETGENATLFKYDLVIQGPVLGFRFMF